MFRRLRALITVISLLVPCGDSLSLPSALGGTLNAPNGDVMQYYGSAVSISGDGNTLAVGNIGGYSSVLNGQPAATESTPLRTLRGTKCWHDVLPERRSVRRHSEDKRSQL